MDKHTQRQEIRSRIEKLDPSYCKLADEAITDFVQNLSEYQKASCIFCYISIGKEVDTRSIIRHAWKSGKRVVVPKCTGKGVMELFEIRSYQDLTPGAYHIPEPGAHCLPVKSSEIDFAIIPCLSCDRTKKRLGHGGGYYDRYLADATFTTAALCREQLLLDHVCCEPHDIPVDMVITEAKIYR